jgi:aconitase A
MTPEYGATAAMFYIDQNTIDYLTLTGRESDQIKLVESYAKRKGMSMDEAERWLAPNLGYEPEQN